MELDSVHNYYERLVFQEIKENYSGLLDDGLLADMACIALNRIPPRYIRYDIDMSFFLTTEERVTIEHQVRKACKKAYKKLLAFQESHPEEDLL
ncbi:late competence development ComFB family protein [Thiomicrorhabdus sp. 6S2-11]|jgi:hypothetical protein|uniref:Late competence development ComFB family protein n=1 Tax=Thiomicrorhabdus marina TaxID=2818442 RepID=A0ABS3Q3Z5_9GAMM|nr:late competence development ComFB family protein [Thiomicrorhabdus marina]MBO1927007.1 late competence development ComFB family protein [Thiomicrorhabdus marina]